MAKLHEDSDDDLPDLSSVIATYAKADSQKPSTRSTVTLTRDQVEVPKSSQRKPWTSLDSRNTGTTTVESRGPETQQVRRQRSLKVAPVNTVLLSRWTGASRAAQVSVGSAPTSGQSVSSISISEKSAKDTVDSGYQSFGWRIQPQYPFVKSPVDAVSGYADKAVSTDDDYHPPRLPIRRGDGRTASPKATPRSTFTGLHATSGEARMSVTGVGKLRLDCVQAGTSTGYSDINGPLATARLLLEDEFSSEPSAMLGLYLTTAIQPILHTNLWPAESGCHLHFAASSSPPRSRRKSPVKSTEQLCFTTPPATPTKSKLQSPKKQHRIPPSPHRPSIDAFWSQEVINDWNDEYSPRKVPKSGRARAIYSVINEDDEGLSPSTCPRRSPVKSPVKRDRKALDAKKAFNAKKHELAWEFLKELDDTVAGGRIATLAATTGGVHLIWSKKLNSTAGRANWRQEVVKPNESGEPPPSKYRHHASIELAEKVIDNENRLINVIAHEYCHLANFMINGVKNNPHGKEFKQWARKCSEAFRHRGIEVTTKHSYIIDYKYIWECTNCGIEFKRHSKSIDPARHTCGSCKSKLVQTKPIPRTAAPSEYQLYFKAHFQPTKNAHPESSHKEVMGLIARAYKEQKAKAGSSNAVPAMNKSEDLPEEEDPLHKGAREEAEIDAVSRTLDFLSLTGG